MRFAFAHPELCVLALVPWVIWLGQYIIDKRRLKHQQPAKTATIYHPFAAVLGAISQKLGRGPSAQGVWRPLYYALWAIIWLLLALAAMEPQWLEDKTQVQSEGVDMVLAVDLSRSMLALDMSPDWRNPMTRITRLGVVKQVVARFLNNRMEQGGDRFGLVLFGDNAYVQSGLTVDGLAVAEMLDQSHVGLAGDSTAIGDALALGVKLLRDRPAKSRVLILLTDGENTAGTILPNDAGQLIREHGIKLYAISVGRDDEVPFPEAGLLGGVEIVMANMKTDEEALKELVRIAGGQFFQATNPEHLQTIYDQINAMETTKAESQTFTRRSPQYQIPLGLALLCLVIGLGVGILQPAQEGRA